MNEKRRRTDYTNPESIETNVTEEPINDEEIITEFDSEGMEETEITEPVSIKGVVTNCLQLNVREAPRSDAKVLFVIDSLSEVAIYENESTDEFYKICTASGLEGFCMKKFIAI